MNNDYLGKSSAEKFYDPTNISWVKIIIVLLIIAEIGTAIFGFFMAVDFRSVLLFFLVILGVFTSHMIVMLVLNVVVNSQKIQQNTTRLVRLEEQKIFEDKA